MITQMPDTELMASVLTVLDRVRDGAEIEITRHGRPIARLVPADGTAHEPGVRRGVAASDDGDDLLSTGHPWG